MMQSNIIMLESTLKVSIIISKQQEITADSCFGHKKKSLVSSFLPKGKHENHSQKPQNFNLMKNLGHK